jgi:hypothetical protein
MEDSSKNEPGYPSNLVVHSIQDKTQCQQDELDQHHQNSVGPQVRKRQPSPRNTARVKKTKPTVIIAIVYPAKPSLARGLLFSSPETPLSSAAEGNKGNETQNRPAGLLAC